MLKDLSFCVDMGTGHQNLRKGIPKKFSKKAEPPTLTKRSVRKKNEDLLKGPLQSKYGKGEKGKNAGMKRVSGFISP